MKKLNDDCKHSTIISIDSLGKNDIIQLLGDSKNQNVKKQYNKNKLFKAEFDILNYVTKLKKKTKVEEEEDFNSFRSKKTGKNGNSLLKKNNTKKKNPEINKNLSFSLISLKNKKEITNQKDKKKEKESNDIDKPKGKKKSLFNDKMSNKINVSSENISLRNDSSMRKENKKDENEENDYKSKTYKAILDKKSLEINNIPKTTKSQFHTLLSMKRASVTSLNSIKKRNSNNSLYKSNFFNSQENEIDNEKNNISLIQKPKKFSGDNDIETILFDEENNQSYLKLTNLSNKNILQLNELRKELKRSFVGKNDDKEIVKKSFLFDDDSDNLKQENESTSDINEKEKDDESKEKYRILTRKRYVYDSFDDEEDNDEEISFNFIYPESKIILFLDFLDVIFNLYNLIFIPLYLGLNDIYFVNQSSLFKYLFLFNILNDIVYFIDIIIPFFVAYYNFDEQLIIKHKLIIQNYLTSDFIINLITGIPYFTIFVICNKKSINNDVLNEPFSNNNFYYLFILLRLLKIFKIYSKNIFIDKIKDGFSKLQFFSNYGRIIASLFIYCISLHIVSCIFIFIGKNNYPNWIYHFNHNNKKFFKLYLTSIYYILTTLTTVGYGDLTCISFKEKFFGLFIEIVGIFAYSWALTAMSNYIKVINDKSEELYNRIKILDDIKLNYPQISDNLYERIIRFLKYKHFNEKKGNNNIIDELPIALRNTLLYEMYKPIIKNFIFFKDFSNKDFMVKIILALKPILALKNDVLIKDGDLVEDIIFVKRGRLSLELPLIISFQKRRERRQGSKNSGSMRKGTLIFNNSIRETTINRGIFKLKPNNKKSSSVLNIRSKFSFSEKEEKENIQYFRILEIRRNEHFGDILMFLDQRSPLSLRVRSKKAELFFLNREDAIEISMIYPQYWKIINKKSLFNMEQIKRLTNKLVNIVTNEHGIVSKKTKKFNGTEYASSISLIEEGDDDLKSIPTIITQESIETSSSQSSSDYEKTDNMSKNKLTESNESSNNKIKGDNNSNYIYKSLKTIVEDDDIESSDLFSNESEKNTIKNNEKSDIDREKENKSNFPNLGNTKYKINSHQKSNKEGSTPYKFEEINNEIYPEENFIISPQSNTNYKCSSQNIIESANLDNRNKKNDKNTNHYFDYSNISICSTEISLSISSEYENIDELSDHKYSKDKSFRDKIKSYIKKELGNFKHKRVKTIEFKDNIDDERDNFNKKKTFDEKNKDEKYKIRKKISKKHKTYKELNNYSNLDDEKKKIGNKKDILTVISQKIEKDNMNLNNPDLFYSSVFMKFMDKKLTQCEDQNMEMNKEEMDFIQRIENMGNLRTFNTKKTKG